MVLGYLLQESYLDDHIWIIINLLLILTIGLMHGSNDLAIYRKVTGTKWKVLSLYYAVVLIAEVPGCPRDRLYAS